MSWEVRLADPQHAIKSVPSPVRAADRGCCGFGCSPEVTRVDLGVDKSSIPPRLHIPLRFFSQGGDWTTETSAASPKSWAMRNVW